MAYATCQHLEVSGHYHHQTCKHTVASLTVPTAVFSKPYTNQLLQDGYARCKHEDPAPGAPRYAPKYGKEEERPGTAVSKRNVNP